MENKACDSVELDNIDIQENWSPAPDVENNYGYQNFSQRPKSAQKKKQTFSKKALKCMGLTAMFVIIVSLGIAILVKYGGKTSKAYGIPDNDEKHPTEKPASSTTETTVLFTTSSIVTHTEDVTTLNTQTTQSETPDSDRKR